MNFSIQRLLTRTFPALILSLCSVVSVTPRPAQAGLLIGALAGTPGRGALIGLASGAAITGVAVGVSLAQDDGWAALGWILVSPITIVGGTLLDMDASLNEEQLAYGVRSLYPSIESDEAIRQIAELSKEKLRRASELRPEATRVEIHFTREELQNILQATSVNAAEFETIVEALR